MLAAVWVVLGTACFLENASEDDGHGGAQGANGLAPFVASGLPISAPASTWTWIEFPDSYCRDGSTSGILVSLKPSSDSLMVFLDGGGACFDPLSCAISDASASLAPPEPSGLLDRGNPVNPVQDWNFVYVPYCTGDVHAGTNPNGQVADVPGFQRFVGRLNMEAFLQRMVPTFAGAQRVLLTGTSAGGFGAAANAVLFQRAFPDVKVRVIDDSGPLLSGDYLPPCLQAEWRDLWGLDGSMLADCGADCPSRDDFVFDYAQYWAKLYSDRNSGLIESYEDLVSRAFFGPGNLDCRGNVFTPVLPRIFAQGLLELRASLEDRERFGTFYMPGRQHTWLDDDSFYTADVGGVSMLDWVGAVLDESPFEDANP